MGSREKFGSRLGFLLISAGCAIGLGNVWRFPFITGQYGGAAFVLVYLVFLIILGIPIMTMEFAVGRASQKSVAQSFTTLQPDKPRRFGWFSYLGMAGNYLLMMFYTAVAGWLLYYMCNTAIGKYNGMSPAEVGGAFDGLLGSPGTMYIFAAVVIILCFLVCSLGLQKGVEKVTKVMMIGLLALVVIVAVRCVTLPGAGEGLRFYLVPDFHRFAESGKGGVWESIYAAMGQAFFTLSIGIGSMAIFGSYLSKERALLGEAVTVTALDTFIAIMAGLIIFPACSAFGVEAGAGPGLLFVSLPNVFNSMGGGQFWGTLFFIFMCSAAFSTVIAVFENIISFGMDLFNWSRKKAAWINCAAILVLCLPCILGFNLWGGFAPFGEGSVVLDLEDFILSNNLLPIGSLIYVLFCVTRYGWGWKNFTAEANTGKGMKFPTGKVSKFYFTFILPAIMLVIFVFGYINIFWPELLG